MTTLCQEKYPYILTYIINISCFQNGFKQPRSSTGFYLKRKIVKGCHELDPFSPFWIFQHLFLLRTYPGNSFLSVIARIFMIHLLEEAFFLLGTVVIMTENVSFSCFHDNHC